MKYIVDNLTDQRITGNLRVDGDFMVTDGTYTTGLYRALMTQAGIFSGSDLNAFNSALIIGETYTITNYVNGDDFSNISNVVSGSANETGCQFIATGEIPANWTNSSTLESSGNLVVTVLENTLGYDIDWTADIGPGIYIGAKATNGLVFNDFPRSKVFATVSQSPIVLYGPPPGPITQFAGPASLTAKDDCITVINFNYDSYSGIDNWLYYTPIEVRIKQNIDPTPVVINGTINPSFPFGYVAFDIFDDGAYVETLYCNDTSSQNDIAGLVELLNTDDGTSFFGTFADNGEGGLTVTMPTSRKVQFSPTGTLTIQVFND